MMQVIWESLNFAVLAAVCVVCRPTGECCDCELTVKSISVHPIVIRVHLLEVYSCQLLAHHDGLFLFRN